MLKSRAKSNAGAQNRLHRHWKICDLIEKHDIQHISQLASPPSGLHDSHRYSSMLAIERYMRI